MPTETEVETAPTTEVEATAKTEKTVKPEIKANPKVVELYTRYTEAASEATTLYADLIDFLEKEKISRPVLIKSLMEASGMEESTAQSQASRFLKISKDPAAVAGLKDGSLSLKAAYEKTKKPQENSASKKAVAALSKEDGFDKALKAFIEAAKASGADAKSILATVKASLADAGVK